MSVTRMREHCFFATFFASKKEEYIIQSSKKSYLSYSNEWNKNSNAGKENIKRREGAII